MQLTSRTQNLPIGTVVQMVSAQATSYYKGSEVIPYDDTIPQISEGRAIMDISITPKKSSNKLKIDVTLSVGADSTAAITAAIFKDTTADAIFAVPCGVVYSGGTDIDTRTISFSFVVNAVNTTARTYSLRVGTQSGNFMINGSTTARIFGGVCLTTMAVTEILA